MQRLKGLPRFSLNTIFKCDGHHVSITTRSILNSETERPFNRTGAVIGLKTFNYQTSASRVFLFHESAWDPIKSTGPVR